MSILKEDGKIEIECDRCKKSATGKAYESGEFREMVTDAKIAGVIFTPKKFGQWEHHCPPCQAARVREKFSQP